MQREAKVWTSKGQGNGNGSDRALLSFPSETPPLIRAASPQRARIPLLLS